MLITYYNKESIDNPTMNCSTFQLPEVKREISFTEMWIHVRRLKKKIVTLTTCILKRINLQL